MNETYREAVVLDGQITPGFNEVERRGGAFQNMMRGFSRIPRPIISIVDRATAPIRAIGGALKDIGKLAAGFVIGQALYALPGLLVDSAKAAADDQASVLKLQQAVANSGATWAAYGDTLTATVDNALRLGFADNDTRDALSLLIAQTGSATEAQKRYGLAMDLARGANIDVVTASKLLGKVTDDNVNVLSRYGIKVAKGATETELFAAIQQKFGGQAETFAGSAAGMMEAFNLQIGELKEQLGYIVLPLFGKLAGFLNKTVVPLFRDVLIPAIADLGNKAAAVLEPLLPMLQPLLGLGQSLWTVFTGFLGTISDVLGGPVGKTALGILGGLADVASAFFQAVTGDPGALGVVGDLIESAFGPRVAGFARAFLSVGMKLIPTIGKIVDAFGLFLSGKFDFGILLQAVGKLLKGLGGTIKHEAEVLGGRLWEWFTDEALPAAKEQLGKLIDAAKRWAQSDAPGKLKDALVKLADSAWSWVKQAAKDAYMTLNLWVIQPIKTWATGPGPGTIKDALAGLADSAWSWVKTGAKDALDWVGDHGFPGVKDAANTAFTWIRDVGWPTVSGAATSAMDWSISTAWPWVQSRATQALNWIETVGWPAVSGAAQTAMDWSINVAWPWLQARATQALTWIQTVGLPMVQAAAEPALHWLVYQAWPDLQANATQAFNWIAFTGFPMLTKAATDAQVAVGTLMDKLKIPQDIRDGLGSLQKAYGDLTFILGELNIQTDLGRTALDLLKGSVLAMALPITGMLAGLKGITTEFRLISQGVADLLAWLAKLVVWVNDHSGILDTISSVVSAGSAAVTGAANTVTGTTPATTTGGFGIPEHASGGITRLEHLAVVGEVPEVIAPLSELSRYGIGGGDIHIGDIHVSVSLGGSGQSPVDAKKLGSDLADAIASQLARKMRGRMAGVVGAVG